MKHLTYLFLGLLLLPYMSWGQENCESSYFPKDFESLLSSACLSGPQERVCGCLKAEAAEKKNAFVSQSYSSPKAVEERLAEKRFNYTNKFLDVYSQMTVESSAQMVVMGLVDKSQDPERSRYVGCTPGEISINVRKNFKDYSEAQIPKLLKQKAKLQRHHSLEDLEKVDAEVARLRSPGVVECEATLNLFAGNGGEDKILAAIDILEKSTIKDKLPRMKELNTVLSIIRDPKKGMVTRQLDEYFKNFTHGHTLSGGLEQSAPCNAFLRFSEEKIEDVLIYSGRTYSDLYNACPDENDLLCGVFADRNAALQKEVAEKFAFDPQKECLSFAEYKAFKSMPGKELLEQFGSAAGETLLVPPSDAVTSLQKQQSLFLQGNPILAKLAASGPRARSDLASALQRLSQKTPSSLTESGRLANYLEFMKKDIGPLVEKNKLNSEMSVCSMMTDSFSAIQIARDIPRADVSEVRSHKLFSQIESCQIQDQNKIAGSNLQATFGTSSIFNLGDSDRKADEASQFLDFKSGLCARYPEYKKNKCASKDLETCRQEFLAETAVSESAKVIAKAGIPSTLGKNGLAYVRAQTDSATQATELKKIWNEQVGSKLSHDFLAEQGQEHAFEKNVEKDQARIASFENPPSSSPSPQSQSQDQTQAQAQATLPMPRPVNLGQERPAFAAPLQAAPMKQNSGPTTTWAPSEKAAEAPERLGERTGVSSLSKQEAPTNLASTTPGLPESASFTKESSQSSQMIPGLPAIPPTSQVAGIYPRPSPSFFSSPQSSVVTGAPQKDQRYGSLNYVLTKLNEQRTLETSGAPQVFIQASVGDTSKMGNPVIVSAGNEISAGSSENFLLLKSDPDKLAEFLSKKISLQKLKPEDIISIQDPSTGSNSVMLFKVVKGMGNALFFEPWPETKIALRTSRLEHLRNSFGIFGIKKQSP